MELKWNIIALLGILLLIAAPAAAYPPTPFLISGWVNDSQGNSVNDPDVVVMSTDEEFVVKTNVSSNYYQAMTSSYNVSAGSVLGFSVNGGAAINHTVTDEIGAGGFEQNLTVPMIQMAGDVNGDGYLTAADAAIVLRMAVRGECSEVADVSGDGRVSSLDALMILQKASSSDPRITPIGDIKANPEAYVGKIVTIAGENLGWNCGGCGYGTPVTRSDWCIEDETGCIYVTGSCWWNYGQFPKIEGMVKICDNYNTTFPYIYCEV